MRASPAPRVHQQRRQKAHKAHAFYTAPASGTERHSSWRPFAPRTSGAPRANLQQVGNRIIKKRIHVRVEHVQPSRCHEGFLQRVKKNDLLKAEAKAQGKIISTKRQPEGPNPGFIVEGATLETVTPIPYDVVNDLKGGY